MRSMISTASDSMTLADCSDGIAAAGPKFESYRRGDSTNQFQNDLHITH
jgi:hypothetical protein